jgi:hypothetical protein
MVLLAGIQNIYIFSSNMAEEEDNTSGDSIDAFSDKFDSLKALYSEKVNVPVPDAPVFDNVSKFESVVLMGHMIKVCKLIKIYIFIF